MIGRVKTSLAEGGANNIFIRFALIGLITIGLLIPLFLVHDVISERKWLKNDAMHTIAASWGWKQFISGPMLVIPYTTEWWVDGKEELEDGQVRVKPYLRSKSEHLLVVLPKDLEIEGKLETETRAYGSYENIVYTAPVRFKGSYRLPDDKDFSQHDGNVLRVHWEKARISFGIPYMNGLANEKVLWNGQLCDAKSGIGIPGMRESGLHANVALDRSLEEQVFDCFFSIRGAEAIGFAPFGERTRVKLASSWPSPSFTGKFLPAERNISESGFTASWEVSHLARSFPQMGEAKNYDLQGCDSDFITVGIFEPVSLYTQMDKATKYAVLFIVITFVAFFAFELASQARLHLLQYSLVGLSMVLFYLTLLSLAEHVPFAAAFIAASAITVFMNSLYIGSALRSKKSGLLFAGILSLLYVLLYVLLNLEDVALLVGTALLLWLMGVLMFITRHLPVGNSAKNAGGQADTPVE